GSLDRGVDCDRRSMNEALDRVQIKARLVHTIEHAGRKMRRGRETFGLMDLTGVGVERQEVCECAPDIDGNADVLQDAVPSSYCAVMLALRAALVKSAISCVRIVDSSSGVLATGSIPNNAHFFLISGCFSSAPMA